MEVFDDYLESLQKLSYLIDSEYMSNLIISLSSMYKVRVYIEMKKKSGLMTIYFGYYHSSI
jgi:hypothetical protein